VTSLHQAIGLHEPNHTTFAYIAEASRMIAEVEDLLIGGAMHGVLPSLSANTP
jgi:hypothetical protein